MTDPKELRKKNMIWTSLTSIFFKWACSTTNQIFTSQLHCLITHLHVWNTTFNGRHVSFASFEPYVFSEVGVGLGWSWPVYIPPIYQDLWIRTVGWWKNPPAMDVYGFITDFWTLHEVTGKSIWQQIWISKSQSLSKSSRIPVIQVVPL